uniref:Molybdopterin biosynthesis MoeB protein n=1 Tax=Laurencia catarinensis TaxID=197326 RepID=UPI0028D6D11E|nr:Molybdopterin biosynthesis MoeB protein [Laurencia catarinensis]WMP12558.1 Molybdopterin biosynthesis MoeB protein [Laurencia catarinensis]
MINPPTNLIKLSQQEFLRYSKQIIIENMNIEGQKRIKKSKILVIGAGGLSCPIMMYLTGSGIGYIGIIDSDKVEMSNLNRQLLYNEIHLNTFKTISAKSQLHKINKNCKVITHKYKLNKSNSKEILKYYDIIIDTTDNFETRNVIYETCYELSKIYVYGAVDNFFGQMSIFNYKDGIQYKDLYSQNINTSQNCNANGIMGITTSYLGSLQAIETTKVIIGYKQNLNNSIILCDLINIQMKIKKIYRQKSYNNITTNNQNRLVKGHEEKNYINHNLILIDIRDQKDFLKKHKAKSINIPLKAFRLHGTIEFLKQYKNQKSISIYCNKFYKASIVSSILNLHQITHSLTK